MRESKILGVIVSRLGDEMFIQEVYFKNIFNTVREAILVLDENMRVLSANRSFFTIFNVDSEHTINSLLYDLGNGQWNIPHLRVLLEDVLPNNDTVDDYEIEHTFESIGRKTMLLNACKIREKKNDQPIILLAIEDITERKELEELLSESEERYRRIFETASDGIVLLEKREGQIVHANPAAENMLGYSEAEYSGKMLQDIGVPLDMSDFPAIMQTLNETGIINYDDVEVKTKSGHSIDTDIYLVDRASLAQCNIRDVSERKRKEKERENLLRWKEDVNLLQQSLLAPATQENKLKEITDGIVRIFNVDFCRIWLIRPGDLCEQGCIHAVVQEGPHVCRDRNHCLHLMASSGRYTHTDGKVHRRVPFGCYKIGLIASGEEHKFLTNDVQHDLGVHNHEWARDLGLESFVGYQIRVSDGQTLGVMALFAKHPISVDEDVMLDGLSSAIALVVQQTTAETALLKSEKKYKDLFDSSLDGIYQIDADGIFVLMNPAGAKMFGYESPDEIIGRKALQYWRDPVDRDVFRAELMIKKSVSDYTMRLKKNNGEPIELETMSTIKEDENNIFNGMEGILRDVTESKKLENQLRHSQKMEAVGTLAGGIAHDFNNILNVIIGYGSMVINTLEAGSSAKEQMREVLIAADRAAELTKRLLVFSRKQVVDVKPVNINELILGLQKMLVRIIRESIDFNLELADSPLIVLADVGQLEQVLINLSSNAKDAMQEGGRLTISTELEEMDDDYVAVYGYGKPGRYALITVSDTGQGMDAETQKKIFEPFFTTKGIGEGTGLGLAISYSIIKQHGGFIKVYSEPGQGTVFKIQLLLSEDPTSPDKKTDAAIPVKRGNETVLVAEDDASLRQLSRIMLESFGYTVITAVDGEDAISKFMENRERISLVMLDMIMPKKNGKEVRDALIKVSPGIKILFSSGYTMDIIKTNELAETDYDFIHKPYHPTELLKKVREILDR
jgi:PAS domain S-box-containing protein